MKFARILIMHKSRKSLFIGIYAAIIALVLCIIFLLKSDEKSISFNEFLQIIQHENIDEFYLQDDFLHFSYDGKFYKIPRFFLDEDDARHIKKLVKITQKNDGFTKNILTFFLVSVIMLIVAWAIKYRQKLLGSMNFLHKKSQKNITLDPKNMQKNTHDLPKNAQQITFNQIAGLQSAKNDLLDLCSFITDPKHYEKHGIYQPKGVLLIGPPGVGKTLLARAFANECKVPFFYQSGSNFVEIYSGAGAKNVRELFMKAKQNSPCIIFIDEIDAIGKKRGFSRSDERENTLNELLTQIDGFHGNDGVMLLAATNRAESLDLALLRSGRFDRKIYLELPNFDERTQLLRMHLQNKIYNLDIQKIAKDTIGFSGSDIATLVNEAALHALKAKKNIIDHDDINALKDVVFLGEKTLSFSANDKDILCIYNVAKAMCATLYDIDFARVSILGDFRILDDEKVHSFAKNICIIKVYVSGFVALKIIKNDQYDIAKNDIKTAKKIIKNMRKNTVFYEENMLQKIIVEHENFLQKYAEIIKDLSRDLSDNEYLDPEHIQRKLRDV